MNLVCRNVRAISSHCISGIFLGGCKVVRLDSDSVWTSCTAVELLDRSIECTPGVAQMPVNQTFPLPVMSTQSLYTKQLEC